DETLAFVNEVEQLGCHYVDVTSGGLDPSAKIVVESGYQVGFAAQVRKHTKIPVRAVGLIHSAQQAETIIRDGKADMVALARAMLANPRWPWLAAKELHVTLDYPPPYQRAAPDKWPGWHVKDNA